MAAFGYALATLSGEHDPVAPMGRAVERVGGLYGLLLAQPATGLAASILKGRPFNLFGIPIPALVAANKGWAADAATLHTLGCFALAGLVLIHASAAILHRVIANDGVLDSMLPIMQRKSARHDQ